jgi:hypothetical protein
LLPEHNIPNVKGVVNQRPLSNEAQSNFGTFELALSSAELKEDDNLAVGDFSDVKGYNDKPLGLGVFTKVK